MFFDLELLSRQHRARFHLAWIASIRGIKHIKKTDVLTLDIGKLCEDISHYVCSESETIRSRFSLRLSATLVNGTMKIYRQQAIYIIEDFFKFLSAISLTIPLTPRSTKRKLRETFDTPPSPIVKTKTKKRAPVEKDTPQSQLQRLVQQVIEQDVAGAFTLEVAEEPAIVQARADEITLREIQPQPQNLGFDHLGDLGTVQLQDLEEELGFQPHVGTTPVTRHLPRLPSVTDESPEQLPVTFMVQAMVHASAEPLVTEMLGEEPELPRPKRAKITEEQPLDEIEQVTVPPREEPEIIETQELPPRPVLAELPITLAEARDKGVVKTQKRTKKSEKEKGLVSTTTSRRVVRIDRYKLGHMQLLEVEELPEFKLRSPNLTYLLNQYLVRDRRESDEFRKKSESVSLRDLSGRPQKKSGPLTPVEKTTQEVPPPVPEERLIPAIIETLVPPESQEPLMASTPLPMGRQGETESVEMQRTREETLATAANGAIQRPIKKRRLLDAEPEGLKVSADLRKMPSPLAPSTIEFLPQGTTTEGVSISLPLSTIDSERDRQQKLLNEIIQSGQERWTLEDVSYKPIDRLNIARTFNDLLVLCKHGYVKLISEENCSKLEFIEKGPKLIH